VISEAVTGRLWYRQVYLAYLYKKNDPPAVLMVCKTGTVNANIRQMFDFAKNLSVFS
jgi:hypothetical protein